MYHSLADFFRRATSTGSPFEIESDAATRLGWPGDAVASRASGCGADAGGRLPAAVHSSGGTSCVVLDRRSSGAALTAGAELAHAEVPSSACVGSIDCQTRRSQPSPNSRPHHGPARIGRESARPSAQRPTICQQPTAKSRRTKSASPPETPRRNDHHHRTADQFLPSRPGDLATSRLRRRSKSRRTSASSPVDSKATRPRPRRCRAARIRENAVVPNDSLNRQAPMMNRDRQCGERHLPRDPPLGSLVQTELEQISPESPNPPNATSFSFPIDSFPS